MADGPIYRDVDDPKAAFVHIHVEDLTRAGAMIPEERVHGGVQAGGVIRREFCLADKQGRPAT